MTKDGKIYCDCCKNYLMMETGEGDASNSIALRSKGFISKNAILFTGVSQWLSFCSKSCHLKYFDEVLNINDPKHDATKEIIAEMKKSIPEMSNTICRRMANISRSIKEPKR